MLALLSMLAMAQPEPGPWDHYVPLSSISGGMLVQECQSDRGAVNDFCTGYILGIADALQLARVTCRPSSDAATIQTVAIVRRYIDEHPERWGEHSSLIVRESLMAAFPC